MFDKLRAFLFTITLLMRKGMKFPCRKGCILGYIFNIYMWLHYWRIEISFKDLVHFLNTCLFANIQIAWDNDVFYIQDHSSSIWKTKPLYTNCQEYNCNHVVY